MTKIPFSQSTPEKKSLADLSFDEECDFSLLPKASCAHCTGDVLEDESVTEDDWVVIRLFTATQSGQCCLVDTHKIKRGDIIGKLQHSGNPFISVPGWACKACTRSYPVVRG